MPSKSAPLSRMAWAMKLAKMIKTMPPETPDALDVSQMLVDVIVAEQLRIGHESLAVLCGLACMFNREAMNTMLPKHTRVDANGQLVYSAAELAQALGMNPEEAHAQMSQAQAEAAREGVSLFIPKQDTTRLQ